MHENTNTHNHQSLTNLAHFVAIFYRIIQIFSYPFPTFIRILILLSCRDIKVCDDGDHYFVSGGKYISFSESNSLFQPKTKVKNKKLEENSLIEIYVNTILAEQLVVWLSG